MPEEESGGQAFGGHELGRGAPDVGWGAAFEFPHELAVLFGRHILVYWGYQNDHQMLKNLYGENTLDQMGRMKWVIADLQKLFSLTPCMGGRKRSQSDNAVGVRNAWMNLCADDEHACSLKELPNQLLVAGDG